MKKIVVFLAALAATLAARAQDQRSTYSVTADFTYTSDYVFRGIRQTDDAIQPSVEVAYDDFYVGFWTNQPIKRHQDDELDFYGGYKYKLTPDLSVEAVGTYYWYPEAKGGLTKYSYEGGVGATYTLRGISTSVYYYHDFKLRAETVQGSIGYSFPLEAIGASLDFSLTAGTMSARDWLPNSGARVRESYNYYGVDVSVPYKLSDKATVTIGGHWAKNQNLPDAFDDNTIWWTAGLTVGF
ncbi:MAG TPA: TorF family putative porin [Opitutaceae bacterium]|nr:TorF family putative porin [Opitutaceae bacterium]